jgi:hypothetical protein
LDGRCKSFDDSADGYARSEAICVVLLQKAKDAKRIYSTLVHGKLNCDGFKEQGITFPSTRMQSVLFKECYLECGVSPAMINYVEAHGTGTRVGDAEEVNAIDNVFTPGRRTPLLIGSGKSNFGHAESASGVCSVAKVRLLRLLPSFHITYVHYLFHISSLLQILTWRSFFTLSNPSLDSTAYFHTLNSRQIGLNRLFVATSRSLLLWKPGRSRQT